ncbi:MAG: hypothetical protein ACC651_12780, partial [Candidatus Scalindua sp.]
MKFITSCKIRFFYCSSLFQRPKCWTKALSGFFTLLCSGNWPIQEKYVISISYNYGTGIAISSLVEKQ